MLAVDKTTSAERDADSAATRSHEPSIASIVGATMMPISTAAQIGPPSHASARQRTARSSRSILVASGEWPLSRRQGIGGEKQAAELWFLALFRMRVRRESMPR